MSTVVKAVSEVNYNMTETAIFLAGTIDNGDSVDWQSHVCEELKDYDITLINPRREDWDSSWSPTADNPLFKEQVEWELSGLINSDIIFMYLAPGSVSPISLLELGVFIDKTIIVVVPDGYFRKGNIEVTLEYLTGEKVYHTLEDGLTALRGILDD